jgi:FKBP-type peptidyl-prolyl cis-trans isomerase SlyD
MRVGPNTHVVADYTLRTEDGTVLDSSTGDGGEPLVYVHGYGMIVPGLEKALTGLEVGASREVTVPPEEGYGAADEELVMEVDRSELPRPNTVEVGDELTLESEDGEEALVRVVEVSGDSVVLDGNHPLAGMTLCYSIVVREVRPATEDEISQAAAELDEARKTSGPDEGDDPGSGGLVQLRRGPPN